MRILKNCEQHMDAGYKITRWMLKHQFLTRTWFNRLTEIFRSFQIFFLQAFHSYLLPHSTNNQQHNSSVLSVAMWTMVFFRFPYCANVDADDILTHYTTIDRRIPRGKTVSCLFAIISLILSYFFYSSLFCFALSFDILLCTKAFACGL